MLCCDVGGRFHVICSLRKGNGEGDSRPAARDTAVVYSTAVHVTRTARSGLVLTMYLQPVAGVLAVFAPPSEVNSFVVVEAIVLCTIVRACLFYLVSSGLL